MYSIKQDKVIAWKKMNADAVALEIEDNRKKQGWIRMSLIFRKEY